jgi:hypothetical protein
MLEHIIQIRPAFDKRSPDPNKDYGIHGVELHFIVKGPSGAVQFVIYTNWHLPHVHQELVNKCNPVTPYGRHCSLAPMAAHVGYHSPIAMYKGQKSLTSSCPYTGGRKCYSDGSSLNAEQYFNILVAEGHESLWKSLDKYYRDTFEEKRSETGV